MEEMFQLLFTFGLAWRVTRRFASLLQMSDQSANNTRGLDEW